MGDLRKVKTNILKLVPYIIVIGITYTIFHIYWKTGNMGFETNDDQAIAKIIGGVHGDFSAYTIFVNYYLSYALSSLSKLYPIVNWWSIFSFGVIFFSYLVIGCCLIIKYDGVIGCLLAATFELATINTMIGSMNFTKTSAICVCAGVGAAIVLIQDYDKKLKCCNVLFGSFSVMLMLCGSLIRFKVFLLAFPFILVIVLRSLIENNKEKLLIISLLALVTILTCVWFELLNNKIYERDKQWSEYSEYNQLRSEILDYDYPLYEEYKDYFEKVGISELDLKMFYSWHFNDSENFGIDTLKKINNAKSKNDFSLLKLLDGLKLFLSTVNNLTIFSVIVLLIVCINFLVERNLLYCYLPITISLSEIAYLIVGERQNERVIVSILLPLLVSLLLGVEIQLKENDKVYKSKLYSFSLIISVYALLASGICSLNMQSYVENKDNTINFLQYIKSQDQKLYVWDIHDNRINASVDPFDAFIVGSLSNSTDVGGWLIPSPLKNGALIRHGYSQNAYKALVYDEDSYLVSQREDYIVMQRDYLREKYDQTISVSLSESVYGFDLYSFSPYVDVSNPDVDRFNKEWEITLKETRNGMNIFEGNIHDVDNQACYYLNICNSKTKEMSSRRLVIQDGHFICGIFEDDISLDEIDPVCIVKNRNVQ